MGVTGTAALVETLAAVGVEEATATAIAGAIGSALTDAAVGAGVGAGSSLLTGGKPLKGAELGAISGGAIGGLGPAIGELTGFGTIASDALAGAAGGALGQTVTGGKPLKGAIEGGVAGGITGALSGPSGPTSAPTGGPGGGTAAAPSSIGSTAIGGDVTGGAGSSFISGGAGTDNLFSGADSSGGLNTALSGGGSSTPNFNFDTGSLDKLAASQGLPSTAGGAAGSGVAAAAPNSLSKFLSDPSFANAGNVITSNPQQALSAAGLVGNAALSAGKNLKGYNQLKDIAGQEQSQGKQLEQYLQTGTLPPGVQSSLNEAAESAKASVRSRYAQMGMSGSSSEANDLAKVDQQIASQGANIATQLLQTGIQESNLASGLYDQIMKQSFTSDQALGGAIQNFASSLVGGGTHNPGEITLRVGQ